MSEEKELSNLEDFVVSMWYLQILLGVPKSTKEELVNDYLMIKMEDDFDSIFPLDKPSENS